MKTKPPELKYLEAPASGRLVGGRGQTDATSRDVAEMSMTFPVAYFKISLYAACGLVGVSNAYAACKPDSSALPPALINDFLQDPEIILTDDVNTKLGARVLSVSVSQYAATGPAAVHAIKSILPSATLQQRVAIGQGLYAAVAFCRAIDPIVATRIEAAIKSIGDKDVLLGYRLAENLSGPSTHSTQHEGVNGFALAEPPARQPKLIGEPSPNDPGSLKLRDPFGSPDTWR